MKNRIKITRNGKVSDTEINNLRKMVKWSFDKGTYNRVLPKSYAYFTARAKGNLIGFVNIISDGVADALLVDLMVHPDLQGKGLGLALVRQAARFVRLKKIQALQVTFDTKLSGFYRKAGFNIFGGGIMDFKYMKVKLGNK
jgi:GNAT superfamily N-acetyltransferase